MTKLQKSRENDTGGEMSLHNLQIYWVLINTLDSRYVCNYYLCKVAGKKILVVGMNDVWIVVRIVRNWLVVWYPSEKHLICLLL